MSLAQANREPGLVTVEEFFSLVPEGQKADLIDGVIYMASPDSPVHNRLACFVQFLMQGYARGRSLGDIYVSRVAFVLSEWRAPEPDIAFLCAERLGDVQPGRINGGPDIAVEIVSHESRTRDYVEKKRLYEEAGVSEYWLVDPIQRRVEFFRLEAGRYALAPLEQNRIFRSRALPGFWLNVDWLLADPLPDENACLREINQGAGGAAS